MSKSYGAIVFAFSIFASSHAYGECVLGNVGPSLLREFSVPRNSVCVIKTTDKFGKITGMKIVVPPKKGKFGGADFHDMAYRAGNATGDDYFEYVSTQVSGGTTHNHRIKNIVHITP